MAMKRFNLLALLVPVTIGACVILINQKVASQDLPKSGSPLPEDVNKILTFSCTPCHSKDGGLMSRAKLNLSEWTNYSGDKQKEKAAKIFSEVSKGAMPPKAARQKRPEIIPTVEQVAVLKKWSESFTGEVK
jgi:hypothetical protein